MTATPAPRPADWKLVETSLLSFLANRNVHKLSGFALALIGLAEGITTPAGWKEVTVGGLYAAVMHIAGAIKKLPD